MTVNFKKRFSKLNQIKSLDIKNLINKFNPSKNYSNAKQPYKSD